MLVCSQLNEPNCEPLGKPFIPNAIHPGVLLAEMGHHYSAKGALRPHRTSFAVSVSKSQKKAWPAWRVDLS